ncbi:hypothetical protein [Blastococcus tunisiensis]|uniref:Uncharacterized protein n=1 Tax=Blastococcus tunisiensis TaxID=1798228 RepID=A0A1I2JJK2_9ACTN|nr:hypothetical protein [Blastococcus sp. DSM 46838]SFF52871.1 hypothetical protein SAMN05216574_1162 [Blastococcus sp. DSM 46838]
MQIERDLVALEASGEDVEHYRDTLPAWYRAVFSTEQAWTGGVNKATPIVDPRDLRLLRALAGQVDSVGLNPKPAPDFLAHLQEALGDARQLILDAGPDVLSDAARRYLLGLVREAERCIEEIDAFGTAAVRRVTFELGGAMASIAEVASDENVKKTWREKSRAVLIQWAGLVPTAAITTVVTQMIEGGMS